jgi:hypothetical protein
LLKSFIKPKTWSLDSKSKFAGNAGGAGFTNPDVFVVLGLAGLLGDTVALLLVRADCDAEALYDADRVDKALNEPSSELDAEPEPEPDIDAEALYDADCENKALTEALLLIMLLSDPTSELDAEPEPEFDGDAEALLVPLPHIELVCLNDETIEAVSRAVPAPLPLAVGPTDILVVPRIEPLPPSDPVILADKIAWAVFTGAPVSVTVTRPEPVPPSDPVILADKIAWAVLTGGPVSVTVARPELLAGGDPKDERDARADTVTLRLTEALALSDGDGLMVVIIRVIVTTTPGIFTELSDPN